MKSTDWLKKTIHKDSIAEETPVSARTASKMGRGCMTPHRCIKAAQEMEAAVFPKFHLTN